LIWVGQSAISNENNTSLQKGNCRKSIYSSALTIKSSQLNSKFHKLETTLQIICRMDYYVTMAPDLYSSESVRTAAKRTKLALKKHTKAVAQKKKLIMQTEHNSGSYS
jgi:hypothetical protein